MLVSVNWDGTLKWTIRDRVVSEVSVKYKGDYCVLSYSCRGVTNNQTIDFYETPCNFGGSRKWFVCHGCRKKVSKLRLFGMSFVCGKCISLGYKSQRINRAGRLQSRAAKLKMDWVWICQRRFAALLKIWIGRRGCIGLHLDESRKKPIVILLRRYSSGESLSIKSW